jgi:hypothetical protein
MKVTKAKGLNPHLAGATGSNPRKRSVQLKRSLAADAVLPRKSVRRTDPTSFVVCCHGRQPNRIEPLCLGYFHLGPQMKVARPPAETGGLSRSEQTWI